MSRDELHEHILMHVNKISQGGVSLSVHQLVRIARLYYEMGYNQKQIADREGISRPKVSRLLEKALQEGIIQIKIAYPVESVTELEYALKKRFGLKKVFVAPVIVDEEDAMKRDVGQAVARFLGEIVIDGTTIGVSWGTTLPFVSSQLQENPLEDVRIVQLNGGVTSTYLSTGSIGIVDDFVHAYNGRPHLLQVPTIVDNETVAFALLSDRSVNATISMGKEANVAVFGIGHASLESVLVKVGYFTEDEFENLLENGAVGDICSRYFDHQGNIVSQALNRRTIGISLDDLAAKEYSIGVAIGEKKAPAILGALRHGYVNCLFIDEVVARKVLEIADIV